MRREAEVRPSSTSSSGITPELRNTAVSWLVEVAAEFQLQQETLFMSVSYFDRFVGLSQVGGGGSAAGLSQVGGLSEVGGASHGQGGLLLSCHGQGGLLLARVRSLL